MSGDHKDTMALARRLDFEDKELWKQLRRNRDFEGRAARQRAQIEELLEKRRASAAAHATATASVQLLAGSLEFASMQEEEVNNDIRVLRESNLKLEDAIADQKHLPHKDPATLYAEEKKREELVKAQHEQIQYVRSHLQKIRMETRNVQAQQQLLFDRQRSAEQDRNRCMSALQDGRSELCYIKQDRIKLHEERVRMEKELAQIKEEMKRSGVSPPAKSEDPKPIPGASGGVRGKVPKDSPSVFEQAREPPRERRPEWTSFPDSSPGGFGAAPPPSFGDIGGGGGLGGGGGQDVFGGGFPGGG